MKLPRFEREKIFAAVDESSKRFEKYTDAERKKFAEDARMEKERAANDAADSAALTAFICTLL